MAHRSQTPLRTAVMRIRQQVKQVDAKKQAWRLSFYSIGLVLAFLLGTRFGPRQAPQTVVVEDSDTGVHIQQLSVAADNGPVLYAPSRCPTTTATPAAPVNHSGYARLRFIAKPWATVAVDDVEVGQTPMRDVGVTPGQHTVELSNTDLHIRKRIAVTAAPNATTLVEYNFFRQQSDVHAKSAFPLTDNAEPIH